MAPAWLPPSAQDIDLAARLRSNDDAGAAAFADLSYGTALPDVEELDACFVARDHNGQALAYVYFEDEPGPRSVRSGPHSRLSPIAFAADECKSLCELPLTREGCRDSRWAMQRPCHRQADTFIKPTRFLAGLITRNAYAPVCA